MPGPRYDLIDERFALSNDALKTSGIFSLFASAASELIDPDAAVGAPLTFQDVDITTARGSGPGGQNRNKVESCVIVTHKATGLQVRIDNERSQSQNKATAMKVLAARLYEAERARTQATRDDARRQQVGTGQRGDKVRTYRTQDDQVTDHRTGVKSRLFQWYNGDWE